ncbi:MAG: transglutaminase [Candidatus Eisenbacteria sp.]|nr:transglutaminase [Candidatus Eisenbacteria bacterium]
MRFSLMIAVAGAMLLSIGSAHAGSPEEPVTSFATPCSNPSGLAWDGRNLWVADWDAGWIYKVRSSDGSVRDSLKAPGFRPQGLAWAGEYLYVSDDLAGRIYEIDPGSGMVLANYETPGKGPAGLASDGETLWLADRVERTIYQLIPHDGTILNYYTSPHRDPRGLAYDGAYLWVSDRRKDEIYMITPDDGTVIVVLKSPGPFPSGLAYGKDRLWVTDFETRTIDALAVRDGDPYVTLDWRDSHVTFVNRLRNDGPDPLQTMDFYVAFPRDSLENQVLLEPTRFSPGNFETVTDRWGLKQAHFHFENIAPGRTVEISYLAHARIADLRYVIYPETVGNLKEIPREITEQYLVDGTRYRIYDPLIQKTVRSVVGEEKNPYWIARKLFNWVIQTLEYEMVGGWDIPTTLIKRGTGSCSEYTFLFIALCRAAGLPARYEAGIVVRGDDASVDEAFHRWAEVYFPNYGWVPVDCNRGDQEWPAEQATGIGMVSNRLLITTQGGGDSETIGWTYNAERSWTFKGRATVSEENFAVWRRAKAEGEPAPAAAQP